MVGMFVVPLLSVVDAEMNDNRQLAHRSKLNEAKCVFAKIREGQASPHFSDEVHEISVVHRAQNIETVSIDVVKEL